MIGKNCPGADEALPGIEDQPPVIMPANPAAITDHLRSLPGADPGIGICPIDMLKLTRHIYPALLNVSDLLPLNSKFLWMDMGMPERVFIPGLSFGIPVLASLWSSPLIFPQRSLRLLPRLEQTIKVQ